jgi:mersacidin/lichenicidin family type 2 lantibiotic
MTKRSIIRAWKDEEYRASLSEAERALLPDSPAGLLDLGPAELAATDGGATLAYLTTFAGPYCSVHPQPYP